jgi:hypothetical protein
VFFSARNILNIGMAITILGVLAMSQTVVIVSGGLIFRWAPSSGSPLCPRDGDGGDGQPVSRHCGGDRRRRAGRSV